MKFENLLNNLANRNISTSLASGLVGGLAGSLLTSKSGRKIGKNALKLGGVAAVGAIAYGAYKKYVVNKENNTQEFTSAAEKKFLPDEKDEQAMHSIEMLLVKAMLAASRADGQTDIKETQTIINQIRAFNLEEREEGELMRQLSLPVDIEFFTQDINSIELATEVYTVSVLVIDKDNEEERAYLNNLTDLLKLPKALTVLIEKEVRNEAQKLVA